MKRKALIYIVFFVLLIGGFLFALTQIIPGFGEVKLPVLAYVQPFSFTDQNGQRITEHDVQGKVYVAEYFFTTCTGICPIMNTNMKKVYTAFEHEPDFMILSHTVDPETDSVGRLKVYADSLGIRPGSWHLVTGRKDSLYNTARISYLLDDPKNNHDKIEDQFIHTQFLALVDKKGRVRKIYDSLKKNELEEMRKDIVALLHEKGLEKTYLHSLFNNNPG
jgi:protein SCO1/2